MDIGLLPLRAREMLIQAANTDIPRDDPGARKRAIDHTYDTIRRDYPQYFKLEPEPAEDR